VAANHGAVEHRKAILAETAGVGAVLRPRARDTRVKGVVLVSSRALSLVE
jgi:hypothetical protein